MASINLNPIERTLYRLFLAHPEGIKADDLALHREELCSIYKEESRFDDTLLREKKIENLCAGSKSTFYTIQCPPKPAPEHSLQACSDT